MIKIRIIPCLDVDNGRVVKGINFVNLIDAGDPVKQAKFYSDNGADEITFLDITATHERRGAMVDIIERTANECLVPLTVGGGIKNIDDMKELEFNPNDTSIGFRKRTFVYDFVTTLIQKINDPLGTRKKKVSD